MPVNIKGKEYVTVAERMELLRQSGKQFEMVESKAIVLGDRVAWQVSLMIGDRLFIGSAEAHLNAKPGSADATDPFACAETSAIGRALGLAGFGSLDAIASADEIVRTQDAPVPSTRDLHDLTKPGSYEQHHRNDATPASNGHHEPDIVIDNLKARILKVQQRAFAAGIKTKGEWAAFRKQFAEVDSDEALTVVGLAKMDGELTIREKTPKTA